jgi:hypothetical protein
LVTVAGIRWSTEENFQAGKGLTGLDEHQVRRWDSWYRWSALAMLAPAFLSITAATEHGAPPSRDQIPLTRNEIAALFSTLVIDPVTDAWHRLRWPAWRRRRQHRARTLPLPAASPPAMKISTASWDVRRLAGSGR